MLDEEAVVRDVVFFGLRRVVVWGGREGGLRGAVAREEDAVVGDHEAAGLEKVDVAYCSFRRWRDRVPGEFWG